MRVERHAATRTCCCRRRSATQPRTWSGRALRSAVETGGRSAATVIVPPRSAPASRRMMPVPLAIPVAPAEGRFVDHHRRLSIDRRGLLIYRRLSISWRRPIRRRRIGRSPIIAGAVAARSAVGHAGTQRDHRAAGSKKRKWSHRSSFPRGRSRYWPNRIKSLAIAAKYAVRLCQHWGRGDQFRSTPYWRRKLSRGSSGRPRMAACSPAIASNRCTPGPSSR